MARLVEALRALGLDGRLSPSGRLVTLDGERFRVYVAESRRGDDYYTWCDDPAERTVEHHAEPAAAIRAGLRRAAWRETDDKTHDPTGVSAPVDAIPSKERSR